MSFFNSIGRNFGGRNRREPRNQNNPNSPQMPTSSTPPPVPQLPPNMARPTSNLRPLFMMQPFVRTHLVKGNFKTITQLPKYVNDGEWIALHVFDFFQHIQRFHGVIEEFCTRQSCPVMSAGPGLDYTWLDAEKRAQHVPAQQYITYVFTWITNRLNDEKLFPTTINEPSSASSPSGPSHPSLQPVARGTSGGMSGSAGMLSPSFSGSSTSLNSMTTGSDWVGKSGGFPSNFLITCQNLYKQMFRVWAHIYHNHFDKIVHLSLEAHFNSVFAFFVYFGKEHNLLQHGDMFPLQELIDHFFITQGL